MRSGGMPKVSEYRSRSILEKTMNRSTVRNAPAMSFFNLPAGSRVKLNENARWGLRAPRPRRASSVQAVMSGEWEMNKSTDRDLHAACRTARYLERGGLSIHRSRKFPAAG